MHESLSNAAVELAALLAQHKLRIVFAESCTAGLVSATLAQVPGVSQWHCGSAVTYRETTKTAWLGISPAEIEAQNVVSQHVANRMAIGVLNITPEADIAASITGHLGPDAPTDLDGVVYIAIGRRDGDDVKLVGGLRVELRQRDRIDRQCEAAIALLQSVIDALIAEVSEGVN